MYSSRSVYVNFRNRFPLASKKSLRYQRCNENGKPKQDGQCNDQRKLDIQWSTVHYTDNYWFSNTPVGSAVLGRLYKWHRSCYCYQVNWLNVSHERGFRLRQTEHIRGNLWHRYSVTANKTLWWWWNFRGDDFRLTLEALGSIVFLLASTLYQGIPDWNHSFRNIVSTEKYILHTQVLLEYCYIWMESLQWEN